MIDIRNAAAVAFRDIPATPFPAFREAILHAVAGGARIAVLFGVPRERQTRLIAVLADAAKGVLRLTSTDVESAYPALTPQCPQAHWFEREIHELLDIKPQGHPWLKPVRFPRGDVDRADFLRAEGDEIHEVAVGPVHAGVIEPGHFRFQCHGERVLHLEISLGYQHRGIERALTGGPDKRTLHYMETLAGDTTIGHATAYAMITEALCGTTPPPRAEAIRAVALELERLANHTGDLGALANDVGYLPTASYCGRLRGDFLNLSALLCGSRFGRCLIRPGGVAFDLETADKIERMQNNLESALLDVTNAADLLWATPSVMGRFEGTGVLPVETAAALGLVGPAARACGLDRDARRDFPFGAYRVAKMPVALCSTGDVLARARMRWLEIQNSVAFIQKQLQALPAGAIKNPVGALAPDSLAVSLVEGWRGEICHAAVTDPRGRFAVYKVTDPSCHNWNGLALTLRDQQISDFPLCNKSYNLSYCGHDL